MSGFVISRYQRVKKNQTSRDLHACCFPALWEKAWNWNRFIVLFMVAVSFRDTQKLGASF